MANVCLIHGVSSAGEWFGDVEGALKDHFYPVRVTYESYRQYGLSKVVCFRGGAIVAVAMGIVALLTHSTFMRWSTVVVATGALALSVVEVYRRNRTVTTVADQISNAQQDPDEHVHVIAHSFGILMLAKALPRTDVSLRHVILVGAILPRDFDWFRLWQKNVKKRRPAFRWVRNEHGSRDNVVRAAWLLRVATGGGASGITGFVARKINPVVVHDVADAFGPCARWPHCDLDPIVHNHSIEDFQHSDCLRFLHAVLFWIPRLLGFEPERWAASGNWRARSPPTMRGRTAARFALL